MEFGLCGKCGHTFAGGAWEPFTRASETNNRIVRRNTEGATAADMAFIAQERALAYEENSKQELLKKSEAKWQISGLLE